MEEDKMEEDFLLLKFLGIKTVDHDHLNGVKKFVVDKESKLFRELNNRLVFASSLKFKTDWNWLHIVVEKIMRLTDKDCSCRAFDLLAQREIFEDSFRCNSLFNNLSGAWEDVYDFIKWFYEKSKCPILNK